MARVLDQGNGLIESVALLLDQARAWTLRRTMRVPILRRIYNHCSFRLSTLYLMLTAVYLPLALKRPDILLAVGPFLSGYMHLIASYWFVQKQSHLRGVAGSMRYVQVLSALTLFSIVSEWTARSYTLLPDMPFGAWEVIVSVFALVVVRVIAKSLSAKEVAVCLVANTAILHYAWREPILFVGGVLIIHNWIAFFYWIMVAKGRERKVMAVLASLLFGLIHYLILTGKTDHWFPIGGGTANFPGNQEITGWYLASWSDDPVVWYRAIVVYAFGISMHYFVWLKAIPESLSKNERPNCFRLTLQRLREDVGSNFLVLCIGLMAVGMLVWCLSFTLGQTIYFAVAALHGWLEITFLICWICLGYSRKFSTSAKFAPVEKKS